jgi:hypothetical protein
MHGAAPGRPSHRQIDPILRTAPSGLYERHVHLSRGGALGERLGD